MKVLGSKCLYESTTIHKLEPVSYLSILPEQPWPKGSRRPSEVQNEKGKHGSNIQNQFRPPSAKPLNPTQNHLTQHLNEAQVTNIKMVQNLRHPIKEHKTNEKSEERRLMKMMLNEHLHINKTRAKAYYQMDFI